MAVNLAIPKYKVKSKKQLQTMMWLWRKFSSGLFHKLTKARIFISKYTVAPGLEHSGTPILDVN